MYTDYPLQCLGNHEFAYKPEGLAPFLSAITFPVVAANIDFSEEPKLNSSNITKSCILRIDGKQIGVIGYTTPSTRIKTYPSNVLFRDEITAIKHESELLSATGIKTIIALGHSGFKTDLRIAREVPLVDLVIGGHTNTFLWNGLSMESPETPQGPYPTIVEQSNGKKVPVVQVYSFTKYMGQLTITINDDGQIINADGIPLLLNSIVPQDPEALNLLRRFRAEIERLDRNIVGRSANILTGKSSKCRRQECTLANLITDAYVAYYKNKHFIETIGLISSKTVYYDVVPKGDGSLSMLDLLNSLPYTGKVYSVLLKGAVIWKTLEIGVSHNPGGNGAEFIHASGLKYVFDMSRPVGSRIQQAKVLCFDCLKPIYQNIILEELYRVTLSELLYTGVDFQTAVKENSFDVVIENTSEMEIVRWYLSQMVLVNKTIEGRIVSIT